ncbi:MAG: hypothetical protein AABZ30_10075 [Myxococcota bacterium]
MGVVGGALAGLHQTGEGRIGGGAGVDPKPMVFRRAWVARLLLDPTTVPRQAQPLIIDLVRPVGRGADWGLRSIMERVTEVDLPGGILPIVSPEDLVLFKVLVHEDRGYDLDDARSVIRERGTEIDRRYLVAAARRLGVRGKLRRVGV